MFDNRIIGSQLLEHFAGSCHNRYVGLIYICILHILAIKQLTENDNLMIVQHGWVIKNIEFKQPTRILYYY